MLKILQIARALARVHLFHEPSPLLALWNVTFRCNLRCPYCDAHRAPQHELATADIIAGLDVLWNEGVRFITFGGGEPLVREDSVEIIQYARKKGFRVHLSTNGWLLGQKQEVLSHLNAVNVSLDGGRELHDAIRGVGTFDRAVQAARLCRMQNVPVSFVCVLSSHNVDRFGESMAVAEAEGIPIAYQPATMHLNTSTRPNPLAPPVEAYRETMKTLIKRKQEGAPVRNSLEGLRHLARWPNPTPIWCSAGVISMIIEPNGQVIACHHHDIRRFLENPPEAGPPTSDSLRLVRPRGCAHCWCANLVEIGLAFSLRPEPMWNAWRYSLRPSWTGNERSRCTSLRRRRNSQP